MTTKLAALSTTRRRFLKGTGAALVASATGGLCLPALAQPQDITIISNLSNVEQRQILQRLATEFEAKSGGKIVINNMDHEAHKTAIRSYLVVGAPDICFWFSGNRMKAFVAKGLFDDISDLFARENYKSVLGATTSAVTVGDKQYGLPMGGILWGLFYRKDVFAQHNWTPPKDWKEFLAFGEAAKSANLVPISMGTKELWPAGGWFDHMNLRINGLDKHIALMDGKVQYTDPMLTPVFDKWNDLLKAGFFSPSHSSFGWEQAGAALAQKKAAMMDLGGFVRSAFPEADLPQLAYAPFPEIEPGVARYEDFSVNSIHVPANAKNKQGARDFLAYFYKPENLGAFLAAEGAIPPRNDCPPSHDPLVNTAVEELKKVVATSQYYDRDTDPDMAQEGMTGLQEFMVKPERREQILGRLEKTRKRIFG
ncbi:MULTISPECIES: ABC transporter substrate-binding protein [unclassified Mesorhizobium]|uniref:ABC transporter substrate-binding protein n=2 Tax=Mesorhizobium TaxID=68287 RepID=UPI000FD91EAE|nr:MULTISPECIES: ABC transporter substrate-binding protein [unclassified Mesorhizobium]TGQ04778.1 carbohydrate ABC transporter substrate-binding protein [Mesorhizobium sp. M2E.F.Ca.ET.219.01.1.1]TGS14344.1 carbohydrate ABC transporter substrate-binding protein [Mesorhizobium sp. M2E.F.Ca.ET.209.01.1.1]TGT65512.1 carbohydrate ABC transporter substrate-binding protein [Mesorhizobium sp. M2E.F.Ca.ET.166.01.1.1]TGV97559.1 carbohydrate ABC transporter substrate-binding protein [Mesorhizobium sp. M2E